VQQLNSNVMIVVAWQRDKQTIRKQQTASQNLGDSRYMEGEGKVISEQVTGLSVAETRQV
jgi:hypothetical protein